MLNLMAAFTLSVLSSSIGGESAVRLGVLSLFNPVGLSVQVQTQAGATLRAGNRSDTHINKDESVRIRRAGDHLRVSVVDVFGRVRQTVETKELTLTPLATTTFLVTIPAKISRLFRGTLSVSAPSGAQRHALRIILHTDREAAVAAIVAAELGRHHISEVYKVMAVVVRTYLALPHGRHQEDGFDYCDTTHCQLYRGEEDLADRASALAIERCVAETAGLVLQYHDKAIDGHYTAVCGGQTIPPAMVWGGATGSDYPYPSVPCRWCDASPYHAWERQADATSVLAALSAAIGFRLSRATDLTVQPFPASEVVRSVRIKDGSWQTTLGGDAFRRALGKRLGWNKVLSPTFRVERRADRIIFRGRGFGSQVGLCVAGATAQAQSGRLFGEILRFYFPGAELQKVSAENLAHRQ